jgi:hypothetical protein
VLGLSVGPSLVRWATEPWPPEWARTGEEEALAETPAPDGAPDPVER